ncbi:MAG: MOP flippase family protein [Synechococcales cyanobacterium M58_A2018_015]|nr:MOP flippase family protein [Synechococcales cyanobacterium M58_A2018_015]
MSLKQKAVKGVIWSILESWGSRVITLVVFFILARLLGPEAFGLVALASVFVAFIQIFLDQGLGESIVQRQNLEPEHLDSAFWMNVGTGLCLSAFGILGADWVAGLFKQPELTPVLRWLSLGFILTSLTSVQEATFRRKLDFRALSVRALVSTLVSGIVGVTMAFAGFGVWSLVGQQLTNIALRAVLIWSLSNWRPHFRFSPRHFRELFSFSINLLGIKILGFVDRRSDDFMIGYFLGPIALGYYTVAYRIFLIMIELLTNISAKVAMPAFSRLQEDPEKLRQAYYQVTQMTALIAFPSFLGMAALAPELVMTLYGEKWLPTVPVMQVLAFIGLLQSINSFTSIALIAKGRADWQLKLSFASSLFNVIAFSIAVHWGIVAVAGSYTVRGYLLFPVFVYLSQKLINIEVLEYLRKFSAPLIASVAMGLAIFGVKSILGGDVYVTLAVGSLVGALAYLIVLQWIEPALVQSAMRMVGSLKKQRKSA